MRGQRRRWEWWRRTVGKGKKALDGVKDYYHNVAIIMLGEFEYMLITAAVTLGDSAYGATIRKHIEEATKAGCAIGAQGARGRSVGGGPTA